jgi:hypothetical protein
MEEIIGYEPPGKSFADSEESQDFAVFAWAQFCMKKLF